MGLFLLPKSTNKCDKDSIGLYRGDRLTIFRNLKGHQPDKTRKESPQLFKKKRLLLEAEYNLKTVNYLYITLDLSTDIHLQTIWQT